MKILHGDCLAILHTISDSSIDAIVTDPPYGLSFMGKKWDYELPSIDIWRECLRVLKPGGHLACFGGSRTHHRVWCAIEDAGFELRDTCMWLHGQGFPKSKDVACAIDKYMGHPNRGRAIPVASSFQVNETPLTSNDVPPYEAKSAEARDWQGWGSALKPSHEPILIARKPLEGTIAQNVLAHGTGGLNIDACRVGTDVIQSNHTAAMSFNGVNHRPYHEDHVTTSHTHTGRWPSNILLDGSDEVTECFPKSKSCDTPSNARSVSPIFGERKQGTIYPGEDGSASRYFSSLDYGEDERRVRYCAKAGKRDRAGSKHPTVKPIKLLEWLCTLICPPGGTILDPFAGSGTTGAAAKNCGFDFILIEREDEYFNDIVARFSPDPMLRLP